MIDKPWLPGTDLNMPNHPKKTYRGPTCIWWFCPTGSASLFLGGKGYFLEAVFALHAKIYVYSPAALSVVALVWCLLRPPFDIYLAGSHVLTTVLCLLKAVKDRWMDRQFLKTYIEI